ncbi:MAG: phospholipase [Petrimonas sp.]|nr:phospholipase [Petrimonas sp.]
MQSLLIFLGLIAFFIIALALWNAAQRRKGNVKENDPTPSIVDEGCCGAHEVCEKDSLIAAFTKEPEYFDDEELDTYQGKDAALYTEPEAEEFREVFYSMLDEEKPRWIRSLQMRGIDLPNQIKDEVLMVINDLRRKKVHA